jgi:hypothetical protein
MTMCDNGLSQVRTLGCQSQDRTDTGPSVTIRTLGCHRIGHDCQSEDRTLNYHSKDRTLETQSKDGNWTVMG